MDWKIVFGIILCLIIATAYIYFKVDKKESFNAKFDKDWVYELPVFIIPYDDKIAFFLDSNGDVKDCNFLNPFLNKCEELLKLNGNLLSGCEVIAEFYGSGESAIILRDFVQPNTEKDEPLFSLHRSGVKPIYGMPFEPKLMKELVLKELKKQYITIGTGYRSQFVIKGIRFHIHVIMFEVKSVERWKKYMTKLETSNKKK